MKERKLRTQALWAHALASELLGVAIIAFGFLSGLSWSEKILIAMAVTLFLYRLDHASTLNRDQTASALEYLNQKFRSELWLDALTLRLALDDLLLQSNAQRPLKFDWKAAMDRAGEDIKQTDQSTRAFEKYVPIASNEPGFFITAICAPIIIFTRGFAGYGLAWLAQSYAPNFVHAIV
jgi:hypothetical protein